MHKEKGVVYIQPMIIITEHAESKFIKALEAIRPEPEASRAVHIKLAERAELKLLALELRPLILEACTRNLPNISGQIFLCEDGDIFILAPSIQTKEARAIIVEVAALLKVTSDDAFAELYECKLYINKMLALIEFKIEKRRKMIEAAKKKQEEELAAKRRGDILNMSGAANSPQEIASRRNNRATPEIMIIEDDAFSRKLVENVLAKQFHLTGLGTADVALATYANLAPDILFLDINLPDVTGHELLEKIIRMDPNAYVVMLSGNADKANIMQAMGAGAKGFIGKPFTKEKLFQYIDRCPTIKK